MFPPHHEISLILHQPRSSIIAMDGFEEYDEDDDSNEQLVCEGRT